MIPALFRNTPMASCFYIITNGRGKMVGGEGDRTKDEVRWNLVSLVRAFGQKTSASTPKS